MRGRSSCADGPRPQAALESITSGNSVHWNVEPASRFTDWRPFPLFRPHTVATACEALSISFARRRLAVWRLQWRREMSLSDAFLIMAIVALAGIGFPVLTR
jgi:hypothetical protein